VIARVWRGATLAEDGDEYAAYLVDHGMERTRDLRGSRGALVLRRDRAGYSEFETILFFDTLDDVKGFAGDALDLAVFFERDETFLVERDLEVRHYEVVSDTREAGA
jgi:antibiotic biosynthesis monooxygenase (ABM) superfamily enzyme